MKSINIDTLDDSFDAIVIGTGITGGWAAKELTEKGIKNVGFGKRKNGQTYSRLSNNV